MSVYWPLVQTICSLSSHQNRIYCLYWVNEQFKSHSHSSSNHWSNKNMSGSSETFLLVVGVIFLIVDFGLFCCSVVGNAIVIYVISRDKKLKSKSNYHILSVAVGDFFIGLVGIPLGVTAVSFLNINRLLFTIYTRNCC